MKWTEQIDTVTVCLLLLLLSFIGMLLIEFSGH